MKRKVIDLRSKNEEMEKVLKRVRKHEAEMEKEFKAIYAEKEGMINTLQEVRKSKSEIERKLKNLETKGDAILDSFHSDFRDKNNNPQVTFFRVQLSYKIQLILK